MNVTLPCRVLAALSALAVFGLAGVQAEPAPQPRELGKQVLPDRVFREIVRESNGFIQKPFAKPQSEPGVVCSVPANTIRANALLIALAAQNRMLSTGNDPDARKLATLRDAALKLAEVVRDSNVNPTVTEMVRKQIALLNQYPDIEIDPSASLAAFRFKVTFRHDVVAFNHEDVASIFSGCDGNKTQLIERNMHSLLKPKSLFAPVNVEKLELLASKVALIADVLREMDDFIPARKQNAVENRKLWVNFANDVHESGWQLAQTVRSGNVADMRQGLTKLDNACVACHKRFRD